MQIIRGATQSKFLKLGQYFVLILASVYEMEIGTQGNVYNGLLDRTTFLTLARIYDNLLQ